MVTLDGLAAGSSCVITHACAKATPGAASAPATATANNFLFINYFSLEIVTWRKEHQICNAPRASLDFSVVRKLLRFCQSASGKTRTNRVSGCKPANLLLFRNMNQGLL